jgi:hypothetical protein
MQTTIWKLGNIIKHWDNFTFTCLDSGLKLNTNSFHICFEWKFIPAYNLLCIIGYSLKNVYAYGCICSSTCLTSDIYDQISIKLGAGGVSIKSYQANSVVVRIGATSPIYMKLQHITIYKTGKKKKTKSYPCNRSCGPLELWDVEAPTFARQSARRWRWGCQPYASAALYPLEDSWYSFLTFIFLYDEDLIKCKDK